MSKIALLLSIALVVLLALPGAAAADWSLDKDKDGVKVYSRAVSGSEYREYKVEMIIDASVEQVYAALSSFGAPLPPRVAAQKVVSRSGNSLVVYQREDCSPLKDREYTMRVTLSPSSHSLEANVATDLAPSTDGLVVVTVHRHTWSVSSDSSGTVATMVMHHDPVDVPDSLYHHGVIGNMLDLKAHIESAAKTK